jgi:hypothetical protein
LCGDVGSWLASTKNGAAKEMSYALPNMLVDYVRDELPGLTGDLKTL